ncbi:hypothetical protein D5018_20105 [Parashewanella curva]|uniref:Uncharacterized protein n=1 Tax=Parashewanella curva TaxID=2338552 RepID=A0A3L8PR98_9GAMM|nr:hypothetical protein [Parashewanella curva]RLV57907.1 hypothetical protein D5018_20105 [Parashewanella curva]
MGYQVFANKEMRIIESYLLNKGDLLALASTQEPQFIQKLNYKAINRSLDSLNDLELLAISRYLPEIIKELTKLGHIFITHRDIQCLSFAQTAQHKVRLVFDKIIRENENYSDSYFAFLNIIAKNTSLAVIHTKLLQEYGPEHCSKKGRIA